MNEKNENLSDEMLKDVSGGVIIVVGNSNKDDDTGPTSFTPDFKPKDKHNYTSNEIENTNGTWK